MLNYVMRAIVLQKVYNHQRRIHSLILQILKLNHMSHALEQHFHESLNSVDNNENLIE